MLTRRARVTLKQQAADTNLKEDLINEEVVEMAVSIRGVLSAVSDRYTSDAIVELLPLVTTLLNKLDECINNNTDMSTALTTLTDENNSLKTYLAKEKQKNQTNLEDSISCEDFLNAEISRLKYELEKSKKYEDLSKKEFASLDTIVHTLQSDCNTLASTVREQEELIRRLKARNETLDPFVTPKKSCKDREKNHVHLTQDTNKYSALASASETSTPVEAANTLVVKADVHYSKTSTTKKQSFKNIRNMTSKPSIKNKIVVLTDSQGKDLYNYLRPWHSNYDIFVYSKPGAKLNRIIQEGLPFVRNLKKEDTIVLLAGTNDTDSNEPAILSITKGINALVSIDNNVNVIVNSVPYRYDNYQCNDNIYYANLSIAKMAKEYRGPLNIVYGDVNSILQRRHYTGHGLHLNKHGKKILAKAMMEVIQKFSLQNDGTATNTLMTASIPAKTLLHSNNISDNCIESYPETDCTTLPLSTLRKRTSHHVVVANMTSNSTYIVSPHSTPPLSSNHGEESASSFTYSNPIDLALLSPLNSECFLGIEPNL